ncbi:MAG: hypothetical protein E3J72_12745 [Planctomycetota bacterium]|nr:MAG: hypothetical protein E3J72_12745 [Planctomycetota bacterium]
MGDKPGRKAGAFTSRREGSSAGNRNAWEVAFAEWEGFRTVAFFDHLILDEEKWTDLQEDDAFIETGPEGVENLLHEIVSSLVPEFGRMVIFTLIAAEWPLAKPDDVSRLSWIFSRPRTKMKLVLERRYRELGFQHEFVARYFVWLSFRKNPAHLKNYLWRLGRMPNDLPDMAFIPIEQGEVDFNGYAKYRALLGRFHDLRVEEIDINETRRMFDGMHGVIYALDGHIYYTTTRESMDELKARAREFAKRYNLTLAEDLVPVGLRGV